MNIIGKSKSTASILTKYRQYFVVVELPPKDGHPTYKIAVGSLKEDIETGKPYLELAPFSSLASYLEDVLYFVLEGAFLLGVHGGFTPQQIKVKIHNHVEETLSKLHRKYGSLNIASHSKQLIEQKIGVT